MDGADYKEHEKKIYIKIVTLTGNTDQRVLDKSFCGSNFSMFWFL